MRIIALDIGEKRVGIAVSDPTECVASPLAVLPADEVRQNAKSFQRIIEDWEPSLFLCGLPMTLSGEKGLQANHVRLCACEIEHRTGIPIEFTDERLSTLQAKRSLREKGLSDKVMRGKVDMIAASLFLQAWLDARKLQAQD